MKEKLTMASYIKIIDLYGGFIRVKGGNNMKRYLIPGLLLICLIVLLITPIYDQEVYKGTGPSKALNCSDAVFWMCLLCALRVLLVVCWVWWEP
jgi:hypothetical protein